MKIKLIFFTFAALLCLTCAADAQESVKISVEPGLNIVKLTINKFKFEEARTELGKINTYKIYEITSPDDPALMRGAELTGIIKNVDLPPGNFIVTLELNNPLAYGKTYMFKISNLKINEEPLPPVRFDLKAKAAISPSVSQTRGGIRVTSDVPIKTSGATVVVNRTSYEISDSNDKLIVDPNNPVKGTAQHFGNHEIDLKLDKKLAEGQTYTLNIPTGIVNDRGETVKASGKVTIPGLSETPDGSRFDIKLNAATAGKQEPSFDMSAKLKFFEKQVADSNWLFAPNLSIDIALGKSQSKNAVILDFPFLTTKEFICEDDPRDPYKCVGQYEMTPINEKNNEFMTLENYKRWTKLRTRLDAIDFRIGPKFEANQKSLVNVLGSVRADFKVARWIRSVADRRRWLGLDLKKRGLSANLVRLRYGYSFIPNATIDFGRKVTAEVIESNGQREVVRPQSIFRASLGFTNNYEFQLLLPMTLKIEENLLFIGAREIIGGTFEAGGVDLRRVRGIHHNGKVVWDIVLDPSKRYSFSVTYENGRWAPNFQYLNKISAGLHLLFY